VTPHEFAAKWSGSNRAERAAAQEHFIDLCRLLGHPTPNEADPDGEWLRLREGRQQGGGRRGLCRCLEAWLAIDPKPLVGDPALDTASLLRDRHDDLCGDPDPERRVRWRLDTLVDLLALDRERMRGWGVVHALAWGLGSEVDEKLVACARWLKAAG
jgi:hypothetical protein